MTAPTALKKLPRRKPADPRVGDLSVYGLAFRRLQYRWLVVQLPLFAKVNPPKETT